jgi:hypothetical protein
MFREGMGANMKRKLWLASFGVVLSACNSAPKEPNFVVVLTGDYRAIADCAFIEFRKLDPAWAKTDLPSMSRIDFTLGSSGAVAGEFHVSLSGLESTRVESRMPQAVWGADFWERKHRPIFEACSAKATDQGQ